jgi:hypothetical protein
MSLAASSQHRINMIPDRSVDSLCLWQQVTNIAETEYLIDVLIPDVFGSK